MILDLNVALIDSEPGSVRLLSKLLVEYGHSEITLMRELGSSLE